MSDTICIDTIRYKLYGYPYEPFHDHPIAGFGHSGAALGYPRPDDAAGTRCRDRQSREGLEGWSPVVPHDPRGGAIGELWLPRYQLRALGRSPISPAPDSASQNRSTTLAERLELCRPI